jgi:hypothetical protein
MCSVVRFTSVVILALASGMLCCCESSSPPPVVLPPSPLANRIQPADPSKYVAYEDVPWNEWKNPRLIVTTRGITVLLSGTSTGSTVPPQSVRDVLEKTTESDWPLGLVVMATIGGVVNDPRKMEANRVELLVVLNQLGIPVVWGPPPA